MTRSPDSTSPGRDRTESAPTGSQPGPTDDVTVDGGGEGLGAAPGTETPRRFRPRLRYEVINCGCMATSCSVATRPELREVDALVVREYDGLRWHRCLRCDAWVPLHPPQAPTQLHPPERDQHPARRSRASHMSRRLMIATGRGSLFVMTPTSGRLRRTGCCCRWFSRARSVAMGSAPDGAVGHLFAPRGGGMEGCDNGVRPVGLHHRLHDIPRRYPDIDLALVHAGGTTLFVTVVTMTGEQAVRAVEITKPRRAIPIHYNDYSVFMSGLDDFKKAAARTSADTEFHYLTPGEIYQLQP